MKDSRTIRADCLVPGAAQGALAVLAEPLSLWGGLDLETGRVCDAHHPQCGVKIAGRVLAMPGGRGSSSSSSILLEAARLGIHPRAIVLSEPDPILAIGALVAADLYATELPVIRIAATDLARLESGAEARISAAVGGATMTLV